MSKNSERRMGCRVNMKNEKKGLMREDRIDRHGGQIDSDVRRNNIMKMYYKIIL